MIMIIIIIMIMTKSDQAPFQRAAVPPVQDERACEILCLFI